MRPSGRMAARLSAAVSRRAPAIPRAPRVGPASHAPTEPARTEGKSGPSVQPARRTADSSAATLHPASTRAIPVAAFTVAMGIVGVTFSYLSTSLATERALWPDARFEPEA